MDYEGNKKELQAEDVRRVVDRHILFCYLLFRRIIYGSTDY
jgi:hypothetical protein